MNAKLYDSGGFIYEVWLTEPHLPGYIKYNDDIYIFDDRSIKQKSEKVFECKYNLFYGVDLDETLRID
jgi:hypothetical protein